MSFGKTLNSIYDKNVHTQSESNYICKLLAECITMNNLIVVYCINFVKILAKRYSRNLTQPDILLVFIFMIVQRELQRIDQQASLPLSPNHNNRHTFQYESLLERTRRPVSFNSHVRNIFTTLNKWIFSCDRAGFRNTCCDSCLKHVKIFMHQFLIACI